MIQTIVRWHVLYTLCTPTIAVGILEEENNCTESGLRESLKVSRVLPTDESIF